MGQTNKWSFVFLFEYIGLYWIGMDWTKERLSSGNEARLDIFEGAKSEIEREHALQKRPRACGGAMAGSDLELGAGHFCIVLYCYGIVYIL